MMQPKVRLALSTFLLVAAFCWAVNGAEPDEKTAKNVQVLADAAAAANGSTPAPPSPAEGDKKKEDDDPSKKGGDDQSKKEDDNPKNSTIPTTDGDKKPAVEEKGGFGAGSIFVSILFGMALMFGLIKMYVIWEKRRDLDPPNYRVY